MFGARPTYFVTRPDGTRTALVEVDQLPASIKIAGVPANLPAADSEDMTCVGNRERAPFQYIIEIAAVNSLTNPSAGKESPLLSGNGEHRGPQNGLGKKKAHVSPITCYETTPIEILFTNLTSFDRTTNYIGTKHRLFLLVPLLLCQLRSWYQLRS